MRRLPDVICTTVTKHNYFKLKKALCYLDVARKMIRVGSARMWYVLRFKAAPRFKGKITRACIPLYDAI